MVIITLFSNILTSSQEFQGWFSGMAQGLRVAPPKELRYLEHPQKGLTSAGTRKALRLREALKALEPCKEA